MKQETTLVSSLRSSSSRRESPPGNHHTKAAATANVGCMSGIFKLISNKYHTRRKFLTFGKRQEKHAPPSSQPQKQQKLEPKTCPSRDQDTPCRPSLQQQEVRNSCSSTTTSISSPPVVARLMGLADIPPSPVFSKVVETAAEKRRNLLGALERCDEDLRALKKIIEAARVTNTPPRTPLRAVVEKEEEEEMVACDEPSPVSVLDHHHHEKKMILVARSPCLIRNGQALQQQEINNRSQSRQYMITKKKPGQEDDNATIHLPNYRRLSTSIMATTPQSVIYIPAKSRPLVLDSAATILVMRCSAAMKEAVSEVFRDLAQGQRREVGRLALILQDIIYGDLVDEIINDFGACYCYNHCFSSRISLPFEACKRQLCF